MPDFKLVSFEECAEMEDSDYGNDTASIEQYGLRCCGTQSEYDLGIRLQEVRRAALGLIETLTSEGYGVSQEILELIDVEVSEVATVRYNIDRRR